MSNTIEWFMVSPVLGESRADATSAEVCSFNEMRKRLKMRYAECAYLNNRNGTPLTLWVDEEGCYNPLHVDERGMRCGYRFPNGLEFAGGFAVTGGTDAEGNTLPTTEDEFRALLQDCQPVRWQDAA